MTFAGGAHSCIGYRFALMEMKALIFTLVRSFDLELAFAPEDMRSRTAILQRPYLASQVDKGAQLPLSIKRLEDL